MASRRNIELGLLLLALAISSSAYLLVDLAAHNKVPTSSLILLGTLAGLFLIAHLVVRWRAPRADPILLPAAAVLNGLGLAIIHRLDEALPAGATALAPKQVIWTALGLAIFIGVLVVVRDHTVLNRYRYTWLLIGIGLLLSPLLPVVGRTINGGRLWVGIGSIQFQPEEAAKIALAVFFASYLTERRELLATATYRVGRFFVPEAKYFVPLLGAWLLSLALFFFEHALGSSLLFFGMFVALLFVATGRLSYVLSAVALFALGGTVAYELFAHVRERVVIWLHVWTYYTTTGYQLAQGLFALGAGGLFGAGWGQGYPQLIPFASTDFVFAALGETLGVVGTSAILLIFLVIVFRGLRIALASRDDFGKLLATGLIATLGLQVFVIVGGVTRLIPLTGITLPFISYGGSSLLANYALIALLLRISSESSPVSLRTGPSAPAEAAGEMTVVR